MIYILFFSFLLLTVVTFFISVVKFFRNQTSKGCGWFLIHMMSGQLTVLFCILMYSSILGAMLTGK